MIETQLQKRLIFCEGSHSLCLFSSMYMVFPFWKTFHEIVITFLSFFHS